MTDTDDKEKRVPIITGPSCDYVLRVDAEGCVYLPASVLNQMNRLERMMERIAETVNLIHRDNHD